MPASNDVVRGVNDVYKLQMALRTVAEYRFQSDLYCKSQPWAFRFHRVAERNADDLLEQGGALPSHPGGAHDSFLVAAVVSGGHSDECRQQTHVPQNTSAATAEEID